MKTPGQFVQELMIDGVVFSRHPAEISALTEEVLSGGMPFAALSLTIPDRDGGMDITRVETHGYVINGGEDSLERGGFCFTYFDEALDDQIVEDVEGMRAFTTLKDPLVVLAIALHYISTGGLHPDHTWHVSRTGNGLPKAQIPAFEIYGRKGWHSGNFEDFLQLLPRNDSY